MRRLSTRITRVERTAAARPPSTAPAWIDRSRAAMRRLMSRPAAYDAALDLEEAARGAGATGSPEAFIAWARGDRKTRGLLARVYWNTRSEYEPRPRA